jgi:mono/diheme cytochrome c family protein
MKTLAAITFVALGVLIGPAARAADDKAALALQARDILKESCSACHKGKDSRGGRFNASIPQTLVQGLDKDNEPVVVPGKPDDSAIWQAIDSGSMPLKNSTEARQMTLAQKNLLRKWIAVGAPAWPIDQSLPPRIPVSIPQMLATMRDFLHNAPVDDRPYLRFYTLTHLYNQPRERVSDADMDLYRAALSKAVNSLTWKPRLVIPHPVDAEKTIFVVDLRELEWDRGDLWKYVLACYPYGLTYENHADPAYRAPYVELVDMSKSDLPYVRADWFVATATRPPLYNALLQLPKTVDELETRLGVNLIQNFQNGRLVRSGFGQSEVSPQANRLVERHDELFGGYWRSYDFLGGSPNSQLTDFPLGPEFNQNPFPQQAFHQAGGEIVFNLPNHLQAYLLVNAKGERIDEAPIAIVSDPQRTSGSGAIVNGLSCMACHDEGMKIGFKDQIRLGTSVKDAALIKVQQLYPPPEAFNERLQEDRKTFLEAQYKALAPFLQLDPDPLKAFKGRPEPISRINQYYRLDRLNADSAAAELGLPTQLLIDTLTRPGSSVFNLGLGPLANGGNINRADWEKITGTSLLQRAARDLGLGTPYGPPLISGFSRESKAN